MTSKIAAATAILNRWMPYAKGGVRCGCAVCETLRHAPYHCDVCGYDGQPLINACSCGTEKPCPPDDPTCSHGLVECPVCVDGADVWTDSRNYLHAWRIIRDVRAALDA